MDQFVTISKVSSGQMASGILGNKSRCFFFFCLINSGMVGRLLK